MTAEDLAKWNVSVMDQKLLKPASYAEMERAVLLTNGVASAYGLGVSVASVNGHRAIGHGGEVSGFTATNVIFPDDRAAVTVLVNQDAIDASETIAKQIASDLFAGDNVPAREARARQILEGLQKGQIDRSLFTANANSYFTAEALAGLRLGPRAARPGRRGQADRARATAAA